MRRKLTKRDRKTLFVFYVYRKCRLSYDEYCFLKELFKGCELDRNSLTDKRIMWFILKNYFKSIRLAIKYSIDVESIYNKFVSVAAA